MTNIIIKESLTPEYRKKCQELMDAEQLGSVRIGQIYVDSSKSAYSGFISLVADLEIKSYERNDKSVYEYVNVTLHKYSHIDDIGKTHEQSTYGMRVSSASGGDMKNYYVNGKPVFQNVEELREYYDTVHSDDFDISEYDVNAIQENALVHIGSADHLKVMQSGMEVHQANIAKYINAVQIKATQQRLVLEKFRSELEARMSKFRSEIARIESVLWTIELYLGVNESVTQIQTGPTAEPDETLHLFQTCSFMDEEVGDPINGGVDFTNISDFDDWLCKINHTGEANYKMLMYPRSVMVFKVRRRTKEYGETNPFFKAELDQKNKKSYILIRNGDCLYRIWADINIGKLFPDADEFEKTKTDSWYRHDPEKLEGKLRDMFLKYQRHMILLQGLIDRTEVFDPMPKIRLQDLPEQIKYLYTNRIMLPTERPLFGQWLSSINKHIDKGSRIVWPDWQKMGMRNRDYSRDLVCPERFSGQYETYTGDSYNLPDYPEPGIYHICGYAGFREEPYIMTKNRKRWETEEECEGRRNVQYKIDYKDDDIINYDLCTLSDIDYYLTSRADRKDYLAMMPLLFEIRGWLLKDKEAQDDFCNMIVATFKRTINIDVEEWVIIKAIDVWKTKNRWKRSLSVDDAKAFRMIVKDICKQMDLNWKRILQ